ncbi:MAG: hypothetical protein V1808_01655, partial [Candidatus Daviesbacteria bacterium]
MKLGIKFYPDKFELIDKYKSFIDFAELFIKPDTDLNLIKNWGIPLTIHAAHENFGFNAGDPKKVKINKKILDLAKKVADKISSPWIIVHPGYFVEKNSDQVALEFFKNNFDQRFLIENCILYDNIGGEKKKCLFTIPSEMKVFLDKISTKMVLDFEHAACSANLLGEDPSIFFQQFLKLEPRCFHISGIDKDAKIDTHKHLFEVENDWVFLKNIPSDSWVTLETGEPREDNMED